MTLRLLISLSLLLAWQAAHAQTAEDFFNSGAQLYISNNIPSALERTESGLKLYPDDVKLKKLEELLKQQQQSQSQQNQQQQQNQQNQQGQSKQQQKNQQSQPQQQNSSGQQNQQKQNQSGQQNKQQQNQSGKKGNEEQQSAEKQGQQMTPEEAKRLLDAQKGNEQILQWKPPGKPENQNRPVKDW